MISRELFNQFASEYLGIVGYLPRDIDRILLDGSEYKSFCDGDYKNGSRAIWWVAMGFYIDERIQLLAKQNRTKRNLPSWW